MLSNITTRLINALSKISVEKENVVGVDITPGNIRVAQLERVKNEWVLSKLGYKHVEGARHLHEIRDDPDIYIEKLKQVIASSKVTTKNAAISVPVSSSIIKTVNLPLMTDPELQEAIDTDSLWENVIQLSESLDEYSIFWQVVSRHTKENTMDLLFVASKLTEIESYIHIVRQAGLNPVVVDIRCFTLRNALEIRKDLISTVAPVILLEIGTLENYLLILKNDAPFISDIYLSDQDRNLLGEKGIDREIHASVFGRYAMQIIQILAAYQSKYSIQSFRTIVVSSTLPMIEVVMQCLSDAMPDIDIKAYDPIGAVRIPENLEEKVSAELNPTVFTPVFGLATRKLDVFGYYQYVTGTNHINLLPGRQAVRDVEKRKFLSRWILGAVAVIVLGIGAWNFFDNSSAMDEVDRELVEYYELEQRYQESQQRLTEITSQRFNLEGMLEASKNIRSNQNTMYLALENVNVSVPVGVSLSSITYAGDNSLDLKGQSLTDQKIIEFISRLGETESIIRASLLAMSVEGEGSTALKNFTVRCLLVEQPKLFEKRPD